MIKANLLDKRGERMGTQGKRWIGLSIPRVEDPSLVQGEVVPGFVDFDSLHFRGFAWFLGGLHEVV